MLLLRLVTISSVFLFLYAPKFILASVCLFLEIPCASDLCFRHKRALSATYFSVFCRIFMHDVWFDLITGDYLTSLHGIKVPLGFVIFPKGSEFVYKKA